MKKNNIIYLVTISGETKKVPVKRVFRTLELAKEFVAKDSSWAKEKESYHVCSVPSFYIPGKEDLPTTFIFRAGLDSPASIYVTYFIEKMVIEEEIDEDEFI